MSILNILVSSTRQWNPGDEFILFGVQNLLSEVLRGETNWTLYDRNPDRWINGWKLPLLKNTNWSNVFRHYTLENFDIAVIAGTIEWYGEPLKRLYSLIRDYNVPMLICGAGYNFGSAESQFDTESEEATIDFSDNEIYSLRHLAQLVIVRDRYVSKALSKAGIPHHLLPCPALFAATQESISSEIRRVAFILQSARGNQSIPEQLVSDALTAINELRAKGLEVEIVCHYIDEFIDFLPVLSPIRYSYDAREYLGLLNSFDVIVSTRLHGAILGNSLGKPAILINSDDMRCKIGAELFPFIYTAPVKDVETILESINVSDVSKQLIDWKLQAKMNYLKLLKPAAKKLSQHFNVNAFSNPPQTVSIARSAKEKPQPELSHAQLKENFSSLIEILKSKANQIYSESPILEQEREELELTLQIYGDQISQLDNMVQAKSSEIGSLKRSLQEKVSRVNRLESQIQQIQQSIPMQLVNRYQKVINKLLPPGNRRSRPYELMLSSVRVILNEGWRSFFRKMYRKVLETLFRLGARRGYYYELGLAGIRVIRNEGWRSFFRKARHWLAHRPTAIKRPRYDMPEFNASISKEEADELVFPIPSQKPKVSIIIPAYNNWRYTLNCLKSIAENTEADYEVVVVDDASTDETVRVLSGVKDLHLVVNEQNIGFLESCNLGAKASKGKYILFLNNDTMVTKGWLPPLLELMNREDVGAVGSKLVYPDGTLQEAGGIVWKEGFGSNYGRGDDPGRPEYNYVRDVDYCSGASLVVKRELFEKIDGFDERFKPAYDEDSDLCFAIRKLGYKVMYQPMSVIAHFEGVSCGTDTSSGIKKYQEINKPKFIEKWRAILQEQHYPKDAENIFLARDRVTGKRILAIDSYVPTYDKDAGSLDMFSMLKILVGLGNKVTFIGDNLQRLEPYTQGLQQEGIEVIYAPYVVSVEDYIRKHGRFFDVVMLSRAYIAIKHFARVKRDCVKAKVVYDTVDLHYLRQSRQASIENNERLLKKAEETKASELYLAKNSDITLVVSPVEKEVLLKEDPSLNVEVIIRSVHNVTTPQKPFRERKDILFIGGFAHPPNVDAVVYFVERILPLIKQEMPDLRFYIVGSNPRKEVLSLQSETVVVTGYVKDLRPYFENCKIFVAPLRYGAGVKGKILLSMSHGVPVVTTSIGAEGIGLVDGQNVLLADDPQEFAQKVILLCNKEELWSKVSRNSLEHIRKYFSYEAAREQLKELIENL